MFATLDPAELERKIGELKVVEGWLTMSLNMMQMSIKTMELQKASLEALRAAQAPARGRRRRRAARARSPDRSAVATRANPRRTHSDESRLYYGSGSPYAWRVAARAGAQGAALRTEGAVVFRGRHAQARIPRAQPAASVPVLVDGDFVLYESNAIVEYLDEAYPATGAPLFPGDARDARAGAPADRSRSTTTSTRRSTR